MRVWSSTGNVAAAFFFAAVRRARTSFTRRPISSGGRGGGEAKSSFPKIGWPLGLGDVSLFGSCIEDLSGLCFGWDIPPINQLGEKFFS